MRLAFSKETMRWNQLTIRKIHKELLKDIDITAGKYKTLPNIAPGTDKKAVQTTPPEDVSKEMKELMAWFNKYKGKVYPPLHALEFHWRFEKIHPFSDGNGRVGRILLNAHLLEYGFMPVIFFSNNHQSYCNAIARAIGGYQKKLGIFFGEQYKKTRQAFEKYEQEGELTGKSSRIGEWSIIKERGPKLFLKTPKEKQGK